MGSSVNSAYCTTREAADMLGVSVRTAQLWVENGQLEAWKTEGGHRRIARASVQRLLERGVPAVLPMQPLKVLIVEDDSILLKLYKSAIGSWSLPTHIITAANGVEGLIRVGRDAPDLMITDLAMPGMDGFQLIHNLAGSSFREGMEILVITGLDHTSIAARGGVPDDIRVLPKPVPFGEINDLLARMIERRAAYL